MIKKGFTFLLKWFPSLAEKALLATIKADRQRLEASQRFSRAREKWEKAQGKYPDIDITLTGKGWEVNIREDKNTWRTLTSEKEINDLPKDLLKAWRQYKDAAQDL